MARTFKLKRGATTIDLLNTASIIGKRGGYGRTEFEEEHFDAATLDERPAIVEMLDLSLMASSHDNLATLQRSLTRILRQALQHRLKPQGFPPVYLEAQARNESNARYALVYGPQRFVHQDLYDHPFELDSELDNTLLQFAREGVWRSGVPGVLPAAPITLAPSDGPASPTTVHVSSFREKGDVTHLFNFTAVGSVYSANLYGGALPYALFPAGTAVNDAVRICSTVGPPRHVVINIGTVGDFVGTLVAKYSKADGSWGTCTLGTHVTIYPGSTVSDLWKAAGNWVVNLGAITDWAPYTHNAVNGWWISIEFSAFTSMTTRPEVATHQPYTQRSPHVEIPSTALKGDVHPFALIRMRSPAGGGADPAFSAIARIMLGARSKGLSEFVDDLDLAADANNPAGWALSYGTDTSGSIQASEAPGGARANCTFATDTSLVMRVRLTGTAKLPSWIGGFRALLLVGQSGGSAGDTEIRLRARLAGTASSDPVMETKSIALKAVDSGLEVVDMGRLRLPFVEQANADVWTGVDLIFDILARRASGASALRFYRLRLIPDDEWFCTLDAPISVGLTGDRALRGLDMLEFDGGILHKRLYKARVSGSAVLPMGDWVRAGPFPRFEPETQTRLYFMMMHYPVGGTWGTGPMIATPGMQLAVSIYAQACYLALRGGD